VSDELLRDLRTLLVEDCGFSEKDDCIARIDAHLTHEPPAGVPPMGATCEVCGCPYGYPASGTGYTGPGGQVEMDGECGCCCHAAYVDGWEAERETSRSPPASALERAREALDGCRCIPAYKDRNLTDPECAACNYEDEVAAAITETAERAARVAAEMGVRHAITIDPHGYECQRDQDMDIEDLVRHAIAAATAIRFGVKGGNWIGDE